MSAIDLGISEERKLAALRNPAVYPSGAGPIEVVETHCSWVFLTSRDVYKMKKAMRLDRMDNRELAARHRNCEEELRLNRRLAPSVYLGLVALSLMDDGSLALDRPGTPVEWLVKMRRLPRSEFLDRAVFDPAFSAAALDPVARWLADFYAKQPAVGLTPNAYLAKLKRQAGSCAIALLEENLGLPQRLVDTVLERQYHAFERGRTALAERAREGRIIEGHGDLKPEHIFLGPPPCIIDCLEFARDLRLVDPLDELAYLEIECERLGADGISAHFLSAYLERAGDVLDAGVYDFYRVRRGTQRALTLAWHLHDPLMRARKDWRALAADVLDLIAAPRD